MAYIRNLDKLGRLVIPMEYRRAYDIQRADKFDISFNGTFITLHPLKLTPDFKPGEFGLELPIIKTLLSTFNQLNPLQQQSILDIANIMIGTQDQTPPI